MLFTYYYIINDKRIKHEVLANLSLVGTHWLNSEIGRIAELAVGITISIEKLYILYGPTTSWDWVTIQKVVFAYCLLGVRG